MALEAASRRCSLVAVASGAERGPEETQVSQAVSHSKTDSEEERRLVDRYRTHLRNTLPTVRARMSEALARSGRGEDDAVLIGVTKGHPAAVLRAAGAEGLVHLAENRPELLAERREVLDPAAVCWHLVGHVQRRKAREVVAGADLFHALDSIRLAERLSRLCVEAGTTLSVLMQINTSGEETKGGFTPTESLEALDRICELPSLDVRGLMTMAPFVGDERTVRTVFQRLRELQERAGALPGYTGTELSMGMSNDYEWALEEGSTMVRIGTALFGERPPQPSTT